MMKKAATGFILVFGVLSAMAQPAKVLNAYNYMNDGELKKAVEEIEPAITHEKTKIDGKTWYYRGQIYEQIFFSEEEKYAQLKDGSLMKAIESFKKAKELGSKRINMNDIDDRYQRLGAFAYQEGVNQFNAKNFAQALTYFETCYEVRQAGGVIDSGAVYSAAVSALNANMLDKAESNFRKSIEIGYSVEDCYVNLANIYKNKGDSEGHKQILAEARQALPNSQDIIRAEINVYLEAKEYDKALKNLDVAIENDKDNDLLYFVRGNIYDTKQADMLTSGKKEESVPFYEKAKTDYEKALSINPEYFDAAYSLGALHFNRGAEMLNDANMLTDDAAYKKAKSEGEAELKRALPYLEKAHALQPDDQSTMASLKELYARTNNTAKYEEMSKKLSN